MRKKLFIGIAAGVAVIGGVAALVVRNRKKIAMEKPFVGIDTDIDDFWDDEDFDFDDEFEDDFDDFDDEDDYVISDPEIHDSEVIVDVTEKLVQVAKNMMDRKMEELHGKSGNR